jgi:hypothetical protein
MRKMLATVGLLLFSSQLNFLGHIIFGALNDSSCKNMILVKAHTNAKGQQTWWIQFDIVTSGRGSDTSVYAALDFTTDYLTLTKSLYEAVGIDTVPYLSKLDDIVFKVDDYTIVLKPEDYTSKVSSILLYRIDRNTRFTY